MKLRPGYRDEYIKRHDAIWPALVELLKGAGIQDYSIFLDEETNTLFAVQKVMGNNMSQDLGNHAVVKNWWDYMADIMDTNPDHSPVAIPLTEVFHLP